MSYAEVEGDLFELGLPALAHGCNPSGVMGAGIAAEFRRRWPDMYEAYRRLCKSTKLRGGYVMPWYIIHSGPAKYPGEPRMIFNLITHGLGEGTSLADIATSVSKALKRCSERNIRQLGIPRIGTGIGGLQWEEVQPVLEKVAALSDVELVVVTLPPPIAEAGHK